MARTQYACRVSTKRVTINDVAAAAGVSRQTVTRAMNAMSGILPETRERVLAISDELGYRPSRFARNLARQKHHAIGLVVPTLRNPYYTDLAADLLDEAAEHDWQTLMATSERVGDSALLEQLNPHVDAVVGYFDIDEADIVLAARGVPVVMVERGATLPRVHSVAIDFERGMADLVAALIARGSRRFALIDSRRPTGEYVETDRRHGFERALRGADPVVVTAPESLESAGDAFTALISAHPQIDTVIAFNDLMAMGVFQRAHQMGLRVPQDIRVVGIDGLSIGALMAPPLTTLSIDRQAIAVAVADIVSTCLDDATVDSQRRVVVPQPLWRESA